MEGASGGSVKIEDEGLRDGHGHGHGHGHGGDEYYYDYITLLCPVLIIYVLTALLLFLCRILRCYQVRNSTAWSWTGVASSAILLLQLWLSIVILSPLLLLAVLLLVSAKGLVSLVLRVRHGTGAGLAGGNDAIWGYEDHGSNSIITAIYIVKGNCDVTKMRDYFQERILCTLDSDGDGDGETLVFEKFMWRLSTLWGFFYWEKFKDFNIAQHVRHFSSSPVQLAQTQTEESIFHELSRIADDTFDFKSPPWEILVFPKYEYDQDTHDITTRATAAEAGTGTGGEGGDKYYAILFRIHHSLIDGVSAGIALNYFLIDKPVSLSIDPFTAPSVSVGKRVGLKLMALFLSPVILAQSLMTNGPNPLHGPKITGPKIFRWSKPISMDVVKRIKNSSKTSVTSVLITAVGGGIFESLSTTSTSSNNMNGSNSNNSVKKKAQVPDSINVATAVAILPYKRTPVNQFSILMLPLPLSPFKMAASSPSPPLPAGKEDEEVGLLQVLRYVYAWSQTPYSTASVLANFYAMKIIGSLPKVLVRLLAGKTDATVSCSNVPGPASFTHVFGGDLVLDIAFWAPMKNKVALGVNFFSYAGRLRTAIVGDSCVFDSPKQVEDLVHSIENQMCSLYKIVEFESLDITA